MATYKPHIDISDGKYRPFLGDSARFASSIDNSLPCKTLDEAILKIVTRLKVGFVQGDEVIIDGGTYTNVDAAIATLKDIAALFPDT